MDPDLVARTAISWADAEGWNPGEDDAERLLAADPGAFLATEQDGEIVATISCALYGDPYAFIGFFIVRSGLRGRGIGTPLFQRALERAGHRVVGLDGVLEQQDYYERRGFVLAHRNVGGARRAAASGPRAWLSCPRCRSRSCSPSTAASSGTSASASSAGGSTGPPARRSP